MKAKTVDWQGVYWFIGLTFVLTWAIEFWMILGLGVNLGGLISGPAQILLTAVMFIPALSVLIVTKYITREGLSETGLRVGPKKQYIVVLLLVVAVFVGAFLLTWILGIAAPDWQLQAYQDLLGQLLPGEEIQINPVLLLLTLFLGSLTINPILTSIATLGEELGWRGYLLPKLLPLGRTKALTICGVIWGLWHAPIIAAGYNYPGYPVLGIILMIAFTTLTGFFIGGLRLKYNSVLLAAWAHAAINTQARGIWFPLFPELNPILGGSIGLTGLVFWGLLAYWSYRKLI